MVGTTPVCHGFRHTHTLNTRMRGTQGGQEGTLMEGDSRVRLGQSLEGGGENAGAGGAEQPGLLGSS